MKQNFVVTIIYIKRKLNRTYVESEKSNNENSEVTDRVASEVKIKRHSKKI